MDISQFWTTANLRFFFDWGIKILGIIGSLFYLFFAIVLLRQTQVMKKTIEINDRGLLFLAAFIQLLLATILLLYSLLFL